MGEKYIDSSILDKAVAFALKAHANTERRGKGIPYIVHPMEAVAIAATMTTDQEILAAAVLHDVVEDTDVTIEELQETFGKRVASLVQSETDAPVVADECKEWHERKQMAIDRIAASSRDSKMVAMSDKLSNIRAMAGDYRKIGDKLWLRFHTTDPKEHEWHYRKLAESLSDLSDTDAYKEFIEHINYLFK